MSQIVLFILIDIINCIPLFACMIFIFALIGIILGYAR